MSQTLELELKCAQCNGTGIHTNYEDDGTPYEGPCQWPGCNGTGDYLIATIKLDPGLDELESKLDSIIALIPNDLTDQLNDIKDKVNDVLDKCNDILEAVHDD